MLMGTLVMRVAVHLFALKLALDPFAVGGVTDEGQDGTNTFDELHKELACSPIDPKSRELTNAR